LWRLFPFNDQNFSTLAWAAPVYPPGCMASAHLLICAIAQMGKSSFAQMSKSSFVQLVKGFSAAAPSGSWRCGFAQL
jgi:hypothetical protein